MNRYEDFAGLVDRMAVSAPSRAALLTCDDAGDVHAITWGEFAERVRGRAEELEARGSE